MLPYFYGVKHFSALSLFLLLGVAACAQKSKADSLENALKSLGEDSSRVKTLNQLIGILRNSDPEKALRYGNEALRIARQKNYKAGQVASCHALSTVYSALTEYKKAYCYIDTAMKLNRDPVIEKELGNSYHLLGIYYDISGELDKSIEYHLKALAIRERSNDKRSVAVTSGNIGGVYRQQNDFAKALEYGIKAQNIYKELGDKKGLATALINLGLVYFYKEDYAAAEESAKKAIDACLEINLLNGLGYSYNNLANVYNAQKKFDLALEYYQKSLEVKEKIGDKQGISATLGNIGSVYGEMKRHKDAINYSLQSLKIARELGSAKEIRYALENLAESYYQEKDYQKAYDYRTSYSNLKDSMFNEEKVKQFTEMQTKYETEKKDNEINLLNKDKELQAADLKQQRIVSYSVIVGLVLVLGLAFFIFKGYREKQKANKLLALQNKDIQHKKEIIEEKNKDITDSINYARRIQRALLTPDRHFNECFGEYFILYKPKDIVSGDFYWSVRSGNEILLATADCTGHGVPGAFMSMIGISMLNEIVIEKQVKEPHLVLNMLREGIMRALASDTHTTNGSALSEVRDGMDMSLCRFNLAKNTLEFAAANNSVYTLRQGAITEHKADKFPVGKHSSGLLPFTPQCIELQKGDVVYTLTDGYADQFGGEKGKKFKYKQLEDLFVDIHRKPMPEQKSILEHTFESWRGDLQQIDDVLIIGIRV